MDIVSYRQHTWRLHIIREAKRGRSVAQATDLPIFPFFFFSYSSLGNVAQSKDYM
jgi:hypothetical protein